MLPILKPRNRSTWNARVARAQKLAEERPAASEVLRFYAYILDFQRGLYERYQVLPLPAQGGGLNLRENLDIGAAAANIPSLIALVRQHGPSKLAGEAAQLAARDPREIASCWLNPEIQTQDPRLFFSRVVLEPQAEHLAEALTWGTERLAGNLCPDCGCLPQMAVLRPEGDGGKRMLLCSLCHSEWEFRRVLCPSCSQEDHEKLPRYTAEGISSVRVEACDSCGMYLKSVDLTLDGLAVPEVDEVASAPLDLWAAEHGYSKIQPNIMGF